MSCFIMKGFSAPTTTQFNMISIADRGEKADMPASEADAAHFLLMLDAGVQAHVQTLTPATQIGAQACERFRSVMTMLVKSRLIVVCQQYTSAVKPVLVGAMCETACSAHGVACASCVELKPEKQVRRLGTAIDHFRQSIVDLLGGDTFTAIQMSAAMVSKPRAI
jgi:hypothetical protein